MKQRQKTLNHSINANGTVAVESFGIDLVTRISPTVISIPRGLRFAFAQCVETRFTLLLSTTWKRLRFGNVQVWNAITTKKVLPLRRAEPPSGESTRSLLRIADALEAAEQAIEMCKRSRLHNGSLGSRARPIILTGTIVTAHSTRSVLSCATVGSSKVESDLHSLEETHRALNSA